jgi:hypothetical protein
MKRRSPGSPLAPCKEDGCDRFARTRGLCPMHYDRLWRNGSPKTEDQPRTAENRFLKFVKWGEPSDFAPELGPCLLWTGADNGNGYGQFSYNGRNGYSHRYAWERVNGPIPDGLTVDHLCRVRRCANVEHMELVDRLTNYMRAVDIRTHCAKGHEYTPDNLYEMRNKPGVKICKTCKIETGLRGGNRRTMKYQGRPDSRVVYDLVLRDELATEVAEGRLRCAEAAERLGCSVKYMDKCARRIRRGERPKVKKAVDRIPKKVREALEDRARIGEIVCCEICRLPANNAHHRRNQSQSGEHTLSNLMMLCGSGVTGCHGAITGNPAMAVRNGWTIQGTEAIPSETAVRRRGELVLLLDDGTIETDVAA